MDLLLYNPESLMRIRPGIDLAALSDIGCERENNEDRYSYWVPASDQQFRQKGLLHLLADGMRCNKVGKEDSSIVIYVVDDIYAKSPGNPSSILLEGFQY